VLKSGDPEKFLGTIEFFPQEGKYHYDGHRKCNILWDPVETLKNREICPVCNKKVTVGVMNRILQLSDRKDIEKPGNKKPFYSIIPLKEILSEISGTGPNSKKISGLYLDLVKKIGPEFDILLNTSIEKIRQTDNELLAEAILRMRNREVIINEGYDGEYGKIHVFTKEDLYYFGPQESLFQKRNINKIKKRDNINLNHSGYNQLLKKKYNRDKLITAFIKEPDEKYKELNPLKGLNPQQHKAASHFTGPALILAGPGTGKTRVLTCRIAELILKRQILPAHILAVTFTNKAAGEMEERLHLLLKNKKIIEELTISTFHSLGYSILKEHPSILQRSEQFFLVDENSKLDFLLHYCKCEKNELKKMSGQITEIKQNLLQAESISDPSLVKVFNCYNDFLQESDAFDLDDLIYYPAKLLSENHTVKSSYQQKFQWILIDEYQDINFAQYTMIKNLIPLKNANLYAIGDPNQAIYGFRGADIAFINTFLDHFSEAVVYKLTQSYRCSNYILKASTQVIGEKHEVKDGLTGIDRGVKISIFPQITHRSEAELIARTIEKMLGGLRFFSMDSGITGGNQKSDITSLSDFAILCRITRQMRVIEKALSEHGIPFQTIGDKPFFKQEPVRSIINILKYLCNGKNIILPYSLSERIRKMNIQNPDIENSIKRKKNIRDKILEIITIYFPELTKENNHILKKIIELSSKFDNNLNHFFLHTDLGTSIDMYKKNMEAVTLLTIHSAKGLEFPCVFIAGCEDGIIPYNIIKNQAADYNEEKRLLYVGMTRAEKYLFLSYAKRRFIFGRNMELPPSPYLNSIEKSLKEVSKNNPKRRERVDNEQLSLF
jgi:superfamily I DNA/RNA helicase